MSSSCKNRMGSCWVSVLIVNLWCFSSLISIEYLSLFGLVEFLNFRWIVDMLEVIERG